MRHLIASQQHPMVGLSSKLYDHPHRKNTSFKKKEKDDEAIKLNLLANEYYHEEAKKNLQKKAELPIEIT